MILWLIPILVILIIWCIVLCNTGHEDTGMPLSVLSSVFLFCFVLVLVIVIPTNVGESIKLQTFYTTNTQNYRITIDKTAAYLSDDEFVGKLVSGSVEKLQQAGYVSERLREWRDEVNDYNATLANMQYWRRNSFFGILYPKRVMELKLLIIK